MDLIKAAGELSSPKAAFHGRWAFSGFYSLIFQTQRKKGEFASSICSEVLFVLRLLHLSPMRRVDDVPLYATIDILIVSVLS